MSKNYIKDVKPKEKIPSIEPLRKGIKAIREHSEKMDRWQKTFDEMFDGYPVYQGDWDLVSSIIELLKVIYKEKTDDDVISWWIYEKDFGRRTDLNMFKPGGEEIIPSNTIEDIYRYLIEYNFE